MKINFVRGDIVQLAHAFGIVDAKNFTFEKNLYIKAFTLARNNLTLYEKPNKDLSERKIYFKILSSLFKNIDLSRPNQLLIRGEVLYFCTSVQGNNLQKNDILYPYIRIPEKEEKLQIEKNKGDGSDFHTIYAKIVINNTYLYLPITTLEKYDKR